MVPPLRTLVPGLLLALVLAQEPAFAQEPGAAAAPRRSLADGLVRQRIETDGLRPPRCEGGLEMAAGTGPLVLLVRRADGSFEVQAIDRGLGDHGEAPEKGRIDEPLEEELEEEVAEAKPEKRAKDGQPAAASPATALLATVRLARTDTAVTIGTKAQPDRLRGKDLDRAALRTLLAESFLAAKGGKFEGQILIDASASASLQDVLTTVELARAAGFTTVMFDGVAAGGKRLPAEQEDLVRGIPQQFGWKVEHLGPAKRQPVCDGELLLLVDGPATWGEIAPLYMLFARAGIWRISFVAQQDAKTRWKLPANLPFDRGL